MANQPTRRSFLRAAILAACMSLLLASTASAQDPVPLYPDNYKVLVENERVRVLDFKLRKGDTEKMHSHRAHVLYVITGFKIQFKLADDSMRIRETKDGDVLFSEAVTHEPLNIGATDAHGIMVELKTPAPGALKPGDGGSPAAMAAEQLLTAVTFIRGLEGKEEELKKELLALAAPTRAEPGCLTYDLYQSPVKKNYFMRYEVWQNAAALEEHKATPHIQASFALRQRQGWSTEITVWNRVPQDKK